ncbi:hypothetical protein CDL15_Pgr014137 [Punica granatum]|uniref:Uncharacterized protein n=1 Tax=Punica granatum TaxID=22663 RepID=A0A218Y0C8_PUNGR|nr:hypothetical protein CDL15_Pgr014137 [Punica granatum]
MDRSHPCLRLDVIIMPSADITRLWNTFRPVDRAFLRLIIGDLPLLADSPIDLKTHALPASDACTATTMSRTTGESCPLSRVGHLRPSPFLHGKTSCGSRNDQPSQAKLTNTNFFLTESVTA